MTDDIITACTMDCPDACSMIVTRHPDGGVRLRGNPDHPFTAGFICRKIRHHLRRRQSPDRITRPLLRRGNGWQAISWDEALDRCAKSINALRHEPASILHIMSDGAKGVLKQTTKLFFARLGATRTRGSLCDAAGFIACIHDFGSRKNNTIEDLMNAGRIVNWGKDFSRSSIHMSAIIRNARKCGAKVLSISPGGDGNEAFSDVFIRIRPGSDRFLAAAVAKRFIDADLIPEAILLRIRNFPRFSKTLSTFSEDRLLERCDVTSRDVDALFRFYTSNGPTATIIGAGVQRYRRGGENVRFINSLALLSGNMGRKGGGSYFHLHSLGNFNLEWTRDPEGKSRRAFPMAVVGREILAADPPIRMIWVNGVNIVNQGPDSREIIRAFASVPFKVVVDAFMNDTAERADLILPAALMLEQEDVIGSFLHDYVQHVPAVLKPPGEARSDYEIISGLGKRLLPPIFLPSAETCFEQALDSPLIHGDWTTLRSKGTLRAQKPDIAYTGMIFDHPDGKARLPANLHDEPDPPDAFPLRFLTLVRRNAIHSQLLPEDQEMPPRVWISPHCPNLKTLDMEKPVDVVSPLGRLRVSLHLLSGLHPGAVVYRRGDWMKVGGGANQLVAAELTDIGGGAAFYDQYVRLENGI
ncbi:molybdopterin-dependent oxidoreductase [Desulfococcus multivorans]|uniref:Molybdopterin oxidoreductase n=1 Tax=Desulfococcus multivorans DSM 2059 TaxID=1121405 RepID=S7V9X1_DESML|nr:molybdopterin-dependent oxidoreductase [Desulfococcus multivorans]AOY58160.1 molybdopterin oxidoreductase [Desulfococcus multivorans]AQV00512.1 molybdopterin oxidoreductase [Desulfococcus multivorans]EPR41273.1 molybdopterin oxidoreductase [Desulfococcus multivorans DSM 2059]SJZ74263.1 Anaerobic selenocysteine-containing dehydrogenase [Desulfococcus multivorans DSM 2059]